MARPDGGAATQPPEDVAEALRSNRSAAAEWESLAPSHRREYLEWIDEAKRPETRERRIGRAVELLAEGKTQR